MHAQQGDGHFSVDRQLLEKLVCKVTILKLSIMSALMWM